MRLCFLCSEYPPSPHGGIGTFTQVLARSLVEEGHTVRVIGIYPHSHREGACEEDRGVQVWRMRAPKSRFGWPYARLQLWKQVSQWAKAKEIDLIEAPDWEGLTAYWPSPGVPVVVRLHGSVSYFQQELNKPTKASIFRLEQSALRRANAWCSVSRYTAEKTKQIFGLRTGPDAVLYNPVEVDSPRHRAPAQEDRVIFTGTLTHKKGIVSLIKAWPSVRERCPNAVLQVYGKDGRAENGGSMLAYLKGLISADADVVFHGHVPRCQLFAAFAEAKVAVFPSYAEAFAVAPLESMVQGCPTIYSQRGSGPELIQDGVDGLLVNPDSPTQIADAIVRVLRDPELADRLAGAGRTRVLENFSIEKLRQQNIEFYERCIAGFQTKVA